MTEFSDRPFVAGSLIGLRAFQVDNLGRLTGVTHRDVWTPGENTAVCHAEHIHHQLYQSTQSWQFVLAATTPREKGRKAPKPRLSEVAVSDKPDLRKHEIASLRCTCGFYAYFDGGNDYLQVSMAYGGWITSTSDVGFRVGGIVEGWGKVVAGTRGFRAANARILALVLTPQTSGRNQILLDKVQRNYRTPIFASEGEALREFPLTEPEPLTPDSCDDFWTRSA